MLLWIGLLIFLQTAEAPYKAGEEYDIKIDVQIKPRPISAQSSETKIDVAEPPNAREKREVGSIPYLVLNLKFLKLSDGEVKVKIVDGFGKTVYQKKSKEGSVIKLDVGFINDVKQGLASGEYKITLLSPDKKPTSRIHVVITRDGRYTVNDVLCGKF